MSFAGLFVLCFFALAIWGICSLLYYLCHSDPPPPPPVLPNGEPPNPGGCDPRKYRTPAQQREWLVAYCKRVNWERAQYTGSMAKRFPVMRTQIPQ